MIKMIIISPKHDLATMQSIRMTSFLHDLINENPQIDVTYMRGIFVNNYNIRNHLLTNHYDLVVYFGHGYKDNWADSSIMGKFTKVPLFDCFKGSVVYTMSCHTAASFGLKCIEYGAIAYIGNTEVVWGGFNGPDSNYGDDFAIPFQNEVLNLLRGVSISDAVNYCKMNFYELSKLYQERMVDKDTVYLDKAIWNADHHVGLGNTDFSFDPVINTPLDLNIKALNRPRNKLI